LNRRLKPSGILRADLTAAGSAFWQQSQEIACGALTLQAARSVLEGRGRGASMRAAWFPRSIWVGGVNSFVGAFVSIPLWGGE